MKTSIQNIKRIGLGAAALLLSTSSVMAQAGNFPTNPGAHSNGGPGGLIGLALSVLMIIAMWKVFTKAGQPGWAAIIPIFNFYVLCKIGGKPGWWVLLFLIPVVNLFVAIIVEVAVAKSFGKGLGFALGMFFLPFIFFPILAFSDAAYQGPAA